ncbi:type II toxin-antitoxin system HicB family antitoxin [Pseudonocardia spinosispora]|uniref:type II toxin-antitoxin system HicB family antitoxin n=1 Tax=Pseudonocardia spinosispora TaxID=103441 RepID=UPI0003F53A79|nr:type II toxin-antitoxin system HicB family antitoxin [Pseudonocardia spinosispora]
MPTPVTFTATVIKDGEWYVSRCLDVEVASQGETIEEALANLREALELYFEDEPVPANLVHPLVTSVDVRLSA